MPGRGLELWLRIRASLGDARKKIREFRRETEGAGRAAGKAKAPTDRLGRSVGRLGDRVRLAAGGWALMASAAAAFGTAARHAFRATIRQEEALAQVEARLRSTASVRASGEIKAIAQEMQRLTAYGDEAVLELNSVLLSFTAIHDILPETTEIVLDMATALGRDLTSTAIQVGKALQDPILGATALRESGVNLTAAMRDQIKVMVESGRQHEAQAILLRELRVEFEGSARAARDTLGGALKALSNAWGDLLEAEGTGSLRDTIEALGDTLRSPEVRAGAQAITSSLLALFEAAVRSGDKVVAALGALSGYKAAAGAAAAAGTALGAVRGRAVGAVAGAAAAFGGSQALLLPGAVAERRRQEAGAAASAAERARLRLELARRSSADASVKNLLDLLGDRRDPALDTLIDALQKDNIGLSAATNARLGALGIAPLKRAFAPFAPSGAGAEAPAPGPSAEDIAAADESAARHQAVLAEIAAAREALRRDDLEGSQAEREDVARTATARLAALDRTQAGWREASNAIAAIAAEQFRRIDAADAEASNAAAGRRRAAHEAAVFALLDPYERARAEIARWLEATLAALDEADGRYEEHARRAREVADERLAGVDERERRDAGGDTRSLRAGAVQALGEISAEARDSGTAIYGSIRSAFGQAGDAVARFAAGAKLEIGSLAESIAADLARIALQRAILGPLSAALGGLFGGGAGAASAGVSHAGGIAGALGGRRRQVPALAFAGAPRLHAGGIAGLRSDEVPAILQRGELVLPRGAGIQPPPVTVNVVNRGTPQEAVRTESRVDPRGLVVDVVVEDIARRGPISRQMEASGMGAAR